MLDGVFNLENIITIVLTVVCALISITLHEFAHGFAAYKLGDDTAKIYGRLSLNPMKHLDPLGALCLILFRFGWAKPVPINSYNFKNKKAGIIIVSLAGPLSNLLLAFLSRVLLFVSVNSFQSEALWYLYEFLNRLTFLNLGLCIFNLIPIPPLDGSKILAMFLKGGKAYRFLSIEKYSSLILLVLFFAPVISDFFSKILSFFVISLVKIFDLIIGVF